MNFRKLLAGWTFRTRRPTYAPGDELTAFVTGYEDGAAQVRIGDTVITLPGVDAALVDRVVRLRVTAFDDADATGRGELIDVVDGD
jgi:hypothetical protein